MPFLIVVFFVLIPISSAVANDAVDTFIESIKTVTYDCPKPEYAEQLDSYLQDSNLSAKQQFSLSVLKSHYLLCNGKATDAQDILFKLVEQKNLDKTAYFYASAIYQIGFAYDLKEQNERCDYYQQATELATNRFSDVFLSASLGFATNCMAKQGVGEQLARMFSVLEYYSDSEDYAALAHIHNSIGLVFGELGQHVLAANQFIKAHEMGREVYTGSNQLTILVSVISSLLASGQFDLAYQSIQEFEQINADIKTPLTNYFYYHALAGYFYRIGNIEEMQGVLPKLSAAAEHLSNPYAEAIATWYQVVPCVHQRDVNCIKTYLKANEQKNKESGYFVHNIDYLKMLVDMGVVLEDLKFTEQAFVNYEARLNERLLYSQSSVNILGIANLHSRVNTLEKEITEARKQKQNTQLAFAVIAFICAVAFVYVWRRKRLSATVIDPDTQLLDAQTAINRIRALGAPQAGSVNALAVFDIGKCIKSSNVIGKSKVRALLAQVSHTLTQNTRDSDIVGKYASEQFILCLNDINEQNAKAFFQRLRCALEGIFKAQGEVENTPICSNMSVYMATEKLNDLNRILAEMTQHSD